MTPKQRKAALKKRKVTQKALAKQIGVAEMSVSRVVNNTSNRSWSDRIMTAVAEAIGKPKERVFPEYYCSHPRRSTSKAMGKNNRYRKACQCLSETAG